MPDRSKLIFSACVLAVAFGAGSLVVAQEAAPPPKAEAPVVAAPEAPAAPAVDAPAATTPEVVPPAVTPEAPPAPGPGAPAAAAPPPPVTPLTAQPPANNGPKQLMLNFKDVTLDTVLEYLSANAGFAVIKDVDVEGRITVVSRQPLSPTEAVQVLNSVLKDKGYAAIITGRALRVVAIGSAVKNNIPVRFGADPDQVPSTDEVVTQVIPVQNVDAVRLKQDLAPLIPAYANMASNASSNSLILTATCADIRRVLMVVRALDTHLAQVAEISVYHLQYASASDAARLINEVFKQEDQPTQRGGGATGGFVNRVFGGGRGGPGGAPGGATPDASSGESGRRPPKVSATADDRTNTLVVSGPPETLKLVASVVRELDSDPSQDQAVFIYHLRNGQAANMQGVLNSLFGSSGASGARTGSTGTARTSSSTGTRSTTGSRTSSTTGARSTGGTSRATGGTTGGARVSAGASAAAASLAGQVYVVADQDTNSIMVMTNPKNFDRVKTIIEDLDRTSPQVLIKVLIAEVTHTKSVDLGVEFSVLNLDAKGNGPKLFTDFGVASQTGGLMFKLVEEDVTSALRALEKIGRLDVLSRPYILASDNQLASITVGNSVPFITSSRITDAGQEINTIQYQDIGIILDVTPHINPDGLVIMDVRPEISALTGETVPISATVDAPVFAKRSASSRVGIKDGQTIVIGGLIEDRKTDTISQVPWLGNIPVVRYFFGRNQSDKSKTELLIFLTPYVAKEAEDLKVMSEQERDRARIVPKAVEPGVFDEHMRNMTNEKPKPVEANP